MINDTTLGYLILILPFLTFAINGLFLGNKNAKAAAGLAVTFNGLAFASAAMVAFHYFTSVVAPQKVVLFDDSLDQLAAFPLDSQMKVHIEVTATWFEDAERGWCGDANYVFDALISERCYKKPMTHEEACRIIEEGAGTQFDPVGLSSCPRGT